MARDGDREVLARLELPLPLDVAAGLMTAIAKAAEKLGYTDVVILTDGQQRIAGTPPARYRRG